MASAFLLVPFLLSLALRGKRYTWLRNGLLLNVLLQAVVFILVLLKIYTWNLMIIYLPLAVFCFGKFLIPDNDKLLLTFNKYLSFGIFLLNLIVVLIGYSTSTLFIVVGIYLTILAYKKAKENKKIEQGIIMYFLPASIILLFKKDYTTLYCNIFFSIISNILILVGIWNICKRSTTSKLYLLLSYCSQSWRLFSTISRR